MLRKGGLCQHPALIGMTNCRCACAMRSLTIAVHVLPVLMWRVAAWLSTQHAARRDDLQRRTIAQTSTALEYQ
ncbi:MAG: hypothetical protein CVV12_03375 [Gammaproteobacteria bacterium HGW-Gammaproteobacteria-2]|nr:MAG: hypothetical protein CVV12_03375 [Gammaproteobacteria bacterium HGW-Gammaproteobacteria-2]